MGLVSRKRKMPSEYLKDGECKNACKRLLTLIVKEVYKNHQLSIGYSGITVYTQPGICQQLREITHNVLYRDYYTTSVRVTLSDEAMEQLNSLSNFHDFGNGHTSLSFPNSIGFSYRGYTGTTRRENFYHCALDCIAFKKHWDECTAFLIEAYVEAQNKSSDVAAKLQEIEKKTKEQQRQRQSDAQRLFNEALAGRMNRS
jgi:hypothetical protein